MASPFLVFLLGRKILRPYNKPIVHYPLSIIHYPLSIIHCPLSIIHCPLSIAHYPLSIVHYQLSIVNFELYYFILSPQKSRRPHLSQWLPIHTLSNWFVADSTISGSLVKMPVSKLRFCGLFMPIPAPVRFAEPM